MSQAKQGSTVKVHYTGKLTNDQIFDSSREREPLEFTVGAGQMIPGFDKAVDGMVIGDNKQITIPAEEAYGPRNEEAVFKIPKTQLPEELEPQVGMQLEANREDGQKQMLLIVGIEEEEVVLDANHPLAGQDLIFDIELVALN
ncbi:peptidylprolyl isomerase [Wenyingzhuangia sp. 2_MG-2023]|uniref:FKBP-type peptidyl-prolyl cis-trans isomerase n=1 Tax=Wenyingzhuangia sp. 2_MG-2023 TaxID=3062639 RepID=UPI0026E400BE|nr:peptidylprolyl isomerase [Wenyingzhuangia sp. 2_MG-2023]MDO6738865.1 peptidylprolyl isomerase [Wenyingzhuangia sp. 2_MG-2023]MDO6803607.1 peptidylprolyl isomerase [Wenyingzhuangia sp. 1_MG-2023]